ncbi:unnamed protein product, partial [Vitis vinifera]
MAISLLAGCLNAAYELWLAGNFQPVDTISQGQSITTSQTIISAGGEFELGFFSPGNSTKYYVGIWYKKVSEPTIVWVANRDYSFTDPSVVLTVRTDGNLEVYAYCGPFGICHDHAVDRFCECLPGLEPGFPNNWNLNDTSGGCVRKADLQCGNSTHDNGERDQFHRVSNVRLPDYPLTLPTSGAMQCESDCLNNCSCSAYSYYMEKLVTFISFCSFKQQVEGMANCYTGHFRNFSLCHLGDTEKATKKSTIMVQNLKNNMLKFQHIVLRCFCEFIAHVLKWTRDLCEFFFQNSSIIIQTCVTSKFQPEDTILQGQSLTTSHTIIFVAGNFELGFFSPRKSTKYYVGIWYKKISKQTIVWVANRDYSFTNPSVVVTVNTDLSLSTYRLFYILFIYFYFN